MAFTCWYKKVLKNNFKNLLTSDKASGIIHIGFGYCYLSPSFCISPYKSRCKRAPSNIPLFITKKVERRAIMIKISDRQLSCAPDIDDLIFGDDDKESTK